MSDDKPVKAPKPKFEVGEIVRLKSGGPSMTVSQYVDQSVKTVWFSGVEGAWGPLNGNGMFHEDVLEKVKAEKAKASKAE